VNGVAHTGSALEGQLFRQAAAVLERQVAGGNNHAADGYDSVSGLHRCPHSWGVI
jgi:hypothetical protein